MTDKSMLRRLSGRLFLLLLLAASTRPAAGEAIRLERKPTWHLHNIGSNKRGPGTAFCPGHWRFFGGDSRGRISHTNPNRDRHEERFHWNRNGNVGGRFRARQR